MNTRRPESPGSRALLLTAALLFAGSTAVTLAWCGSMAAMPGMTMPGGWNMSMAWMRMPGQSWGAAAMMFLGMWTVMMVAMMLPALAPALLRLRSDERLAVATGYFSVWAASGLVIFALGAGLAEMEMHHAALARAVPVVSALVVTLAGLWQLSNWKSRQLSCCRASMMRSSADGRAERAGWRSGLRFGQRCFYCCGPLTAILLMLGVMELWVMTLVTVAITLERTAPRGWPVARVSGASMLIAGGGMLWLTG